MPRRLSGPPVATALLIIALALGWASPDRVLACGGPACARPVTTSLHVPLTGTVGGDGNTEAVDLDGELHVVSHAVLGEGDAIASVDVYLNVVNTRGLGQQSGATYLLLGAGSVRLYPPDPIAPPFTLDFTLMPVAQPPHPIYPPDPIRPVALTITLTFNPDLPGTLSDVAATLDVLP